MIKNSKKELVKNSYLIFSIVSVTVGLILFWIFIKSILFYFSTNEFSFLNLQTADYFLILFSILWIFVGLFLFFLFQKINKFDQISDSNLVDFDSEKMISIFEFQFLKLLKHKSEIVEKMEYEFIENDKICKISDEDFLLFFEQKLHEISTKKIDFLKPENHLFLNLKFEENSNIKNEDEIIVKLLYIFEKQLNTYIFSVIEICDLISDFEQKFKEKNESDLLFLNRQISHLKNQFSESEKAFILCISKVNEKMNF